jgi:hypothetical protein
MRLNAAPTRAYGRVSLGLNLNQMSDGEVARA